MSEQTPKHLRHIDRESVETQRVVSNLGGDPNAKQKNESLAGRKLNKNQNVHDPIKEKMDLLFYRLEQPYCPYREENKLLLKRKLTNLRKTDLKAMVIEIRKVLGDLDELEAEYNKKQAALKERNRKSSFEKKQVSLIDRISFWLYRYKNSHLYDGNKPSLETLNAVEIDYKSTYNKIQKIIDHLVYTQFSKHFFDSNSSSKASFRAYNLLSLLSSDNMGKALASVTKTFSGAYSLKDKVLELNQFAKLHLTLISNEKYIKDLKQDLKLLLKTFENLSNLPPILKDNMNLNGNDIKLLIDFLPNLLDQGRHESQYLPKLEVIYSCFFGYKIEVIDLREYLDVPKGAIEDSLILPPRAKSHCRTLLNKLNSELELNRASFEKIIDMNNQIELGEIFLKVTLAGCSKKDMDDYDNDPLLFLNRMVSDFLNIFEDLLLKKKLLGLESLDSPISLFRELGGGLQNEINQLMVRQEFIGKIKKDIHTETKRFRVDIFNTKTETYKNFSNTVDYIKKSNAHTYFKLMRRFEREINTYKAGQFDLLQKTIVDTDLCQTMAQIYSMGNIVQSKEHGRYQACLIDVDKFGIEKTFSSTSLFALLKLGQTIMCYFADYVGEVTVRNLRRSKVSKEEKIHEIESQIKLFPNIDK